MRMLRFLVLLLAALPDRRTEPGDDQGEWEHFNERCASTSLKTLTSTDDGFRTNDRDWDHVNDFWGGTKALYTMTLASDPEGLMTDEQLQLAPRD